LILQSEIELFEKDLGRDIDLIIDPRTPLILPYHRQRDKANERKRLRESGSVHGTAGSVGFGAGYGQAERTTRLSLRAGDLLYPEMLEKRVAKSYDQGVPVLKAIYGEDIETPIEEAIKQYKEIGEKLRPRIDDVSKIIMSLLENNKTVLCESSQGCLLDLDYGTWPFTTGSNLGSGRVFTGLGIPPQEMTNIGVVKGFNSRAGYGPFPTKFTEKDEELRKYIVKRGDQVERFPGIPERDLDVGWLDLVALKYVCKLHGINQLAVTHLDTLAGLDEIKVATQYVYKDGKNKIIREEPDFMQSDAFADAKPVLTSLFGWKEIGNIKKYNNLPREAKDFVELIEMYAGVPVKYVSFAQERGGVIEKK
jgi:adenylosuccinate synthase